MAKSNSFPQFNPDNGLQDIATYQVGGLESAAHRALRAYKDRCLSKYGLSGMQWYIIGTIYDSGYKGMRITDLSKRLGTTLGFMTNSVNLLQSKSILERQNSSVDSRAKIVVVNDSYRPTCRKIEKDLRAQLRKTIYKDITPKELKSYIKTLQALATIGQDSLKE